MKHLAGSESAIITIDHENKLVKDVGRKFKYSLNDKRTKSKLLKGAKRTFSLDVEFKTRCANLRFCDGSYVQVLLPLLSEWGKDIGNHEKIAYLNETK